MLRRFLIYLYSDINFSDTELQMHYIDTELKRLTGNAILMSMLRIGHQYQIGGGLTARTPTDQPIEGSIRTIVYF